MFNIIVVDDEVFAVEGIKSAVNWSKLGIDEVFTAFNIRQAKEVFENNRVDIMLCDIEMPQGNGLELLSWVRANRSKTECIFLTCHADFGYAKEALKLGSLDYILKPIPYDELEEVIKKAIDKIKKNRKLTEESQLGQYWNKNRAMIVETFWRDIINHAIAPDIKAIEEASKEKNIQINKRAKLVPVLIKVHQWGKNLNSQEENLMDFALKNIAAEKFFGDSVKGQFVKLEQKRFIVIVNSDVLKVVKEKLKEVCEKFIETCNQYISCDLCCYIGDEVYIDELSSNVNQLVVIDENNVAFTNKVFLLNNRKIPASTIKMPDMAPWSVLLNEGSKDKVIEEIQSFLQGQVNSIELNANMLYQFQQDFLQMIYTLLKQKGIQAHQLLGDEKTKELYSKAISSIKAFMLWVSHVVDKSIKYIYDVGRSQSVVDRAKKYISDHISEEITRDDIASFVFLNPDYLNRIFKKETNMSISEYLQQERFNIARELLKKTDFPVSSIAVKVGYTNFSHFAKMFKKYTGMNPMEYRQKNGSV